MSNTYLNQPFLLFNDPTCIFVGILLILFDAKKKRKIMKQPAFLQASDSLVFIDKYCIREEIRNKYVDTFISLTDDYQIKQVNVFLANVVSLNSVA